MNATHESRWRSAIAAAGVAVLAPAAGAHGATVPTIDTEDDSLGSQQVGDGRFHPIIGIDVRNGDFARGGYDDDAANLDRVPVHAQIGFAWDLHRTAGGDADAWLVGTSSNGFHSPAAYERVAPRAWYESNNLLGAVIEPAKGLRAGIAYTIKTSPNAVASTTHEASVTIAYEADRGLGMLHPSFAATVHPKGGTGVFTQVGIEPQFDLSASATPATIGIPVVLGIGWRGFYAPGSGTVGYGSAGVAFTRPFAIADTRWTLRAQALAVVRDDALRHMGSADAETATVIPLVTIGVSIAI